MFKSGRFDKLRQQLILKSSLSTLKIPKTIKNKEKNEYI